MLTWIYAGPSKNGSDERRNFDAETLKALKPWSWIELASFNYKFNWASNKLELRQLLYAAKRRLEQGRAEVRWKMIDDQESDSGDRRDPRWKSPVSLYLEAWFYPQERYMI